VTVHPASSNEFVEESSRALTDSRTEFAKAAETSLFDGGARGRNEDVTPAIAPAARVLLDSIDLKPRAKVLDIGCGCADPMLIAAERVASVTGLDLTPRLIELAQRAARERDLGAVFYFAQITVMPFPGAGFDLVVDNLSEVLVADRPAVIRELIRGVKLGGHTAWVRKSVVSQYVRFSIAAVTRALGVLRILIMLGTAWKMAVIFAPHGFNNRMEGSLADGGPLAEEWMAGAPAIHPISWPATSNLKSAGMLAR
jgi:SAM-dependent methyltransferase